MLKDFLLALNVSDVMHAFVKLIIMLRQHSIKDKEICLPSVTVFLKWIPFFCRNQVEIDGFQISFYIKILRQALAVPIKKNFGDSIISYTHQTLIEN